MTVVIVVKLTIVSTTKAAPFLAKYILNAHMRLDTVDHPVKK